MSLFRFALYFLPENLRPPPNSKLCARNAHSNLVFLHFPRLSDLSLQNCCPSKIEGFGRPVSHRDSLEKMRTFAHNIFFVHQESFSEGSDSFSR